MVSSLINSATVAEQTLDKNVENVELILGLQEDLRLEMVASLKTQKEMNEIMNRCSKKIEELTSNLSASFDEMNSKLENHYSSLKGILTLLTEMVD